MIMKKFTRTLSVLMCMSLVLFFTAQIPAYALVNNRYAAAMWDNSPYHNAGDMIGVYLDPVPADSGIDGTVHEVTDADHLSQSPYYIDIPSLPSGTTSFALIIQMDIREVDDGYQELYIYDGLNSNATQLADHIEFEHGPGKKDTTWYRYTFYTEILPNQIIGNKIYLRFGAHGTLGDKWQYKNITIRAYCGSPITSHRNVWSISQTYHPDNIGYVFGTNASSSPTYPVIHSDSARIGSNVYLYWYER